MAKQVLTNVRYFMGPADLTGQSNKVELEDSAEEKETTNYGSGGAKEVIAGIESVAIAAEGYFEGGGTAYAEAAMYAARRTAEAHTLCPDGATVGSLAYLTKAIRLPSKPLGGAVGDVAMWTLGAAGTWALARGAVAWSPGTSIAADANGTGVQLGAVPAGQRLYASYHVLSITGGTAPTLGVTIQSGTSNAFAAPTTRLTFATASATGSEVIRTSVGAITDTWYRAVVDITDGGIAASFLIAVAFGIA